MITIDERYDHPGKVYVGVFAYFDPYGKLIPQSITWEDGRVFELDDITDVQKAASLKAGGCGVRYTCRIMGSQKYLFLEEDRWFVERQQSK